jgi:hypothetical protein
MHVLQALPQLTCVDASALHLEAAERADVGGMGDLLTGIATCTSLQVCWTCAIAVFCKCCVRSLPCLLSHAAAHSRMCQCESCFMCRAWTFQELQWRCST